MFNPLQNNQFNPAYRANEELDENPNINHKRRLKVIAAIALVIFGLMTFPKLTLIVTAVIILAAVVAKACSSPVERILSRPPSPVVDQVSEDEDVDDKKQILSDFENVD